MRYRHSEHDINMIWATYGNKRELVPRISGRLVVRNRLVLTNTFLMY